MYDFPIITYCLRECIISGVERFNRVIKLVYLSLSSDEGHQTRHQHAIVQNLKRLVLLPPFSRTPRLVGGHG